ncbi:MAG: mercuric transporter MerT family protein [Verrucomicrobiota bacterium]
MKKEFCPKCGEPGKSVKEITLQSLLKGDEKERITALPYFFCKTPSCPVVYFNPSGVSIFEKNSLKVRVGIKENKAPRPVCYCFDHSIEEIEAQVETTGESTVLDDIATRMKDECWCETKSPMGSCCMSTVSKHIKTAKEKAGQTTEFCSALPEPTADSKSTFGILATLGAVLTAILSSACCWLPLLLIAFGASAVGVSGFFESYRFWFLAATIILLASGFYLLYFRQEKCTPADCCSPLNPKLQRFNKILLWCATIAVALFSVSPSSLGFFLNDPNPKTEISYNQKQITLKIEGMTCKSCIYPIQTQLLKVEGITSAKVDFDKATAVITTNKKNIAPQKDLLQAVKNAGFKAVFQKPITPSPPE